MDLKVYKCPVTGRFLDPFEVYRLLGHYTRYRWNEMVDSPDPAARHALLVAGRKALGMPGIDAASGQGWLEPQVEQALEAFAEYVAGKGRTATSSHPSSPSSAFPPGVTPKPCSGCP